MINSDDMLRASPKGWLFPKPSKRLWDYMAILGWQRKSYCLLEIHDGEDIYAMNET
jgi:hypothetical protein